MPFFHLSNMRHLTLPAPTYLSWKLISEMRMCSVIHFPFYSFKTFYFEYFRWKLYFIHYIQTKFTSLKFGLFFSWFLTCTKRLISIDDSVTWNIAKIFYRYFTVLRNWLQRKNEMILIILWLLSILLYNSDKQSIL